MKSGYNQYERKALFSKENLDGFVGDIYGRMMRLSGGNLPHNSKAIQNLRTAAMKLGQRGMRGFPVIDRSKYQDFFTRQESRKSRRNPYPFFNGNGIYNPLPPQQFKTDEQGQVISTQTPAPVTEEPKLPEQVFKEDEQGQIIGTAGMF